MGPFVTVAAIAWADQLDAYVVHQDRLQPLGDSLLEAGAVEGSRLVVLTLPPDTPADVVRRAAGLVLDLTQPRPLTADELGAAWWHGPPSEMPDDVGSI